MSETHNDDVIGTGERPRRRIPTKDDFTTTVDGAAAHAGAHWDRDDAYDPREERPDLRDTL